MSCAGSSDSMKDGWDWDGKENMRGGSKSSKVAVVTKQEVVKQPRLLHPLQYSIC